MDINKGHIILYGKSGIGKTTYVKNELKNKDEKIKIDKYIICNNNTGINYIKNDIINFCKIKTSKLKVIVFDNCECLTIQSQLILRVIMEKYSNNNRFVFICINYKKLIIPIQSRCIIKKHIPQFKIPEEEEDKIDISLIFNNKKEKILEILLNKNYNIKILIKEYCNYYYNLYENEKDFFIIINKIAKLEKYINYCSYELIYLKLLEIHYKNNLNLLKLFFFWYFNF